MLLRCVLTSVVLLSLAACGEDAPDAAPATPAPTAPTTSATGSPASSPTVDPDVDLGSRCSSRRIDRAIATIEGPGGSHLPVVELGSGGTTAVFLHQSDGDGLCGWLPYAEWLVAHHPGVRALLVDLCRYGDAECPGDRPGVGPVGRRFAGDQGAQAAFVARWARARDAERVVLVGASMGGAVALAAADRAGVDAVVDLSGPPDWPGSESADAARGLRVPALVAVDPDDPYASFEDLRAAYDTIPARPKRFVRGRDGHGYELLADTSAPLATTVADWIVGRYTTKG